MSGHQPLLPEYEVQEPSGLPIYYGDGDDTTPIYHSEAEGEIPNKPMRLAFSQIDGQTSIVVSNADTSAPLYNIQLDDNLAAWVNMSPTAILANPDNLPPFETTAPAFTTIQFGTHALLNSFDPYRHDIRRWGYKITIPDSNNNGSNLSSNFPLDEGTNLYAVGLFETTKTKYQWIVTEFLDRVVHQTPLDPGQTKVQFRLYGTKVHHAKTEFGRFLNGFKGPAMGIGWERCGIMEFTMDKSRDGAVNGVMEPLNGFVFRDHQECALVAGSVVEAVFAYKYRLMRYRLKQLNKELY